MMISYQPPSMTWRPLYRRIPYTSYHVTNLQPDRDYCFRVQAENVYGLSQPTNAVRLTRLSVQQYFSYIVAVSFIGGGNWKYPVKTTDLSQGTDKLDHIMLYRIHRHERGSKSQS
jgi:hypothetical protein